MASTEAEKIQQHFQTLSSISGLLNTASDELTKAVGCLDDALKRLNIGLSVWVPFRDRSDPESNEVYDVDEIGYAKVNGTWGIAIQHAWGDSAADHHCSDGPWLFTDAPREMRIQAVDKLPEMIEEMSKVAAHTQKKIQEKTKQVRELADAIRQEAVQHEIAVNGLSRGQVKAITVAVSAQQKFLAEIVQHANRWDLDGDTLRLYFSAQKRPFGEMLQGREALLKVQGAAQGILGTAIKIGVQIEQQLAQTRGGSSKVQK